MWKFIVAAILFTSTYGISTAAVKAPPKEFSKETKLCIECHKNSDYSIVQQWGESKHYRAKVGCYECHKADPKDPDAYIHDEKRSQIESNINSADKKKQDAARVPCRPNWTKCSIQTTTSGIWTRWIPKRKNAAKKPRPH